MAILENQTIIEDELIAKPTFKQIPNQVMLEISSFEEIEIWASNMIWDFLTCLLAAFYISVTSMHVQCPWNIMRRKQKAASNILTISVKQTKWQTVRKMLCCGRTGGLPNLLREQSDSNWGHWGDERERETKWATEVMQIEKKKKWSSSRKKTCLESRKSHC